MQRVNIKHNRISEYLMAGLYIANGNIDEAIALVKENINHYPHDVRLAKLVSQFMLAQGELLFTKQQQLEVNKLKHLLSPKLQKSINVDINLLTGNYQPILADKVLYQQLLTDADNLTVDTDYQDNVLWVAAYLYAHYG